MRAKARDQNDFATVVHPGLLWWRRQRVAQACKAQDTQTTAARIFRKCSSSNSSSSWCVVAVPGSSSSSSTPGVCTRGGVLHGRGVHMGGVHTGGECTQGCAQSVRKVCARCAQSVHTGVCTRGCAHRDVCTRGCAHRMCAHGGVRKVCTKRALTAPNLIPHPS